MTAGPWPLVYRRPRSEAIEGGLLYAVVGLLVMAILALFVGTLVWGLAQRLGARPEAAGAAGLAAGGAAAVAAFWFALRDFRRRTRYEVRVWPDRLEAGLPGTWRSVAFAELETLQFLRSTEARARDRLRLVTAGGERVELWDFSPAADVYAILLEAAAPLLAARLRARIDRGDTVRFVEPGGQARWWLAGALGFLAWAALVAVAAVTRWQGFDTAWRAFLAISLPLGLGLPRLRQWWLARGGGLVLSVAGVAPARPNTRGQLRWSEVRLAHGSDHVAIQGLDGGRLVLSEAAENYAVFAEVARSYLPV